MVSYLSARPSKGDSWNELLSFPPEEWEEK